MFKFHVTLVLACAVAAIGCDRQVASPNPAAASAENRRNDHQRREEPASIALSPAALKNIGYVPHTVALGDYERTISLPGMVVERPGVSQLRVSAPLGGIVTRIYVLEGEAVGPGAPLFEIRLTHEELVSAQGEFLETAESLDVVNAEIARLESIAEGVVAGRRIVEQQYERQKLEARLRAQRQGLLLHGLSDSQIDEILQSRELLKAMLVTAPSDDERSQSHADHPFHVQSLAVQVGQQVAAGDSLCTLADHCELYIEGTAFEVDIERLRQALQSETPVAASILPSARGGDTARGLKLLYLADRVDTESRGLHFYVHLPNEIIADRREEGRRFVQWRFNPGQRVEVRLPADRWPSRLVVPASAVVYEGPEAFVYRQSGDQFHQVPVHVEHRDQKSAVIANDGAVFPGEVIAGNAAFQIHLALKNKSGAAADPHAGHGH